MDLHALQLFCDLVETRSFTRAAERSLISQSAVSQRIRSLERQYGQILIERGKGKGRAAPTPAGMALYEGSRLLLAESAALEARVRGHVEELAGTVRVATVYSVGLHALPGRLKPFLAAHREVYVHLEYSQTGKIYRDVIAGAVDLGIVACPVARRGVEVVPFGEEEMVLVCAPENPFAQRADVALAELEGQPFIAFDDAIPTRRMTDQVLRAAGVSVRTVAAFDNIETIKNLVEIGTGVALLPLGTVRPQAREGTLTAVPLSQGDSFRRPTGILLKAGRIRRAAVQAFVEAIQDGDMRIHG